MEENKSGIGRWLLIGAVAILLIALVAYNASHPSQTMTVWNENMTMGDKETAAKHYIVYTDIFCPYCDKFANAIAKHDADFKKEYIEDQHVYYEVRMTALVNKMHKYDNSQLSAEGSYCAAKQNKFWDYYHAALDQLWEDYHSKGIGVDRDSEHIPELGMDYFLAIGKKAGLEEESFNTCMNNHEAADEVEKNTIRAQQITKGGIPYYQFGDFKTGGFDGNWDTEHDWQNAKTLLNAGLR